MSSNNFIFKDVEKREFLGIFMKEDEGCRRPGTYYIGEYTPEPNCTIS